MRLIRGRGASVPLRYFSIVALAWLLAACGGGGDSPLAVDAVTGLPADTTVLVVTDNGQQLYFAAPGVARVEIHLDKPGGPLIASASGDRGRAVTGNWIRDGMRFYLQDVSNGRPLTVAHTLATAIATVDANTPGKPGATFGATAGLVPDPLNTGLGTTTLFWNAPAASKVEVRVNSPDGALLAQAGPVGSQSTGNQVTDGMRFYLQDATSGISTSAANTLALATVDLQPSRQRYLGYYTTKDGVLIHSRDSMHRLGAIPNGTLPIGVTATDMHASPDGTLLYLLASDFNYYVLDPADDSLKATFPAGSQSRSFGFMKGPMNEDLLIAAPDNLGNVAIVDPATRSRSAALSCPCFGSVSGIMVNPVTKSPFFVSVRPALLPPVMPAPGVSELVLYSVTPNLQLATPYPLPLPSNWSGSAINAGASMLLTSTGAQGTLVVAWTELRSFIVPNLPTDLVAYDLATRTTTTLTQAFTFDAALAVPELASSDGTSVYAQPRVIVGAGPDQRGTIVPGDLSRFQATPGAALPFARDSTFTLDNPLALVTPPLALDERYVFFGQVSIVGNSNGQWSSQPSSPFYLYRADRTTLQPAGSARIIVDDNPTSASSAPLIGFSTGSYESPKM